MRRGTDRILTSHVGSLPTSRDLWSSSGVDLQRLKEATREVLQLQRECGIDIVNEGEVTKGGNWVVFVNERLTGFEGRPPGASVSLLQDSVDWLEFSEFYKAAMEGGTLFEQTRAAPELTIRRLDWSCTGPIEYCGETALQREINCLKEALGDTPPGDAFLTSTAPASLEPGRENVHYKS